MLLRGIQWTASTTVGMTAVTIQITNHGARVLTETPVAGVHDRIVVFTTGRDPREGVVRAELQKLCCYAYAATVFIPPWQSAEAVVGST